MKHDHPILYRFPGKFFLQDCTPFITQRFPHIQEGIQASEPGGDQEGREEGGAIALNCHKHQVFPVPLSQDIFLL